jgi:hypothetical protein
MAKVKTFQYLKEEGKLKDYELLVIKDMETCLEGISIHDLSKDEKQKVIDIYNKFEEELQPYMKNYRKFLKTKIIKSYN